MIQQFHYWIFIQRKQIPNSKNRLHPHIYCSIIYNSQDIEKILSAYWLIYMYKENVVCLYNGMLFKHKIGGNPIVIAWMDFEGIMLKWNMLDRKRQIPYNLTYIWKLK